MANQDSAGIPNQASAPPPNPLSGLAPIAEDTSGTSAQDGSLLDAGMPVHQVSSAMDMQNRVATALPSSNQQGQLAANQPVPPSQKSNLSVARSGFSMKPVKSVRIVPSVVQPAQHQPSATDTGPVQRVEARPDNFRASIFAGALAAANIKPTSGDGNPAEDAASETRAFVNDLNRKSYRQARADELYSAAAEEPIPPHDSPKTYAVSRGELVVAERYRCVRKIAFGSTSVVYLAYTIDYEQEAAVKACSFSKADHMLRNEASCYHYLKGGPGIPRLYWYGMEQERHYLVTELLGPNLMDMLHYCDGRFSLPTVCMLGVQIFESLDWIHRTGYIHRDIRPQNFCLGNGPQSKKLFVLDFAAAIKFRPKVRVKGGDFIPHVVGTRLKGQAIYDSIGAHYGNEHSYRDDVESALYMLVHFLMGDLPWRGLKYTQTAFEQKDKSKTLLDRVCEKKLTSSFLDSCPPEFQEMYKHIRSLKYEDIPNYELLIHLCLTMLNKTGATFDYQYDWARVPRLALYKRQVERKRKILDELLDSHLRPLLLLQAHRIQFIKDDPAPLPSTVSVPSATVKKAPSVKEEKPTVELDVEAQTNVQKVASVKEDKPEKELFRRYSLRQEQD